MIKTAFFCDNPGNLERVYAQGRRQRVGELSDLLPTVLTQGNLAAKAPELTTVEALFSTWGMPCLSEAQLALLPSLRAVFYAAGSVKGFAEPLLARQIVVVSAWQANAVPVAEFALAQILLANKGFFANARQSSSSATERAQAWHGMAGNFGETVALLGAGAIGRKLIELLRPFHLHVVVWDPFLDAAEAASLGIEKVETLAEAFERALTVSNHLANVPATVGLLTGELFARLRPHATFINTGRGATVDEAGLAAVLASRPDLTALLDVTFPEPPPPESPLYGLANLQMTSHIAGSLGDEVVRMADFVIEEFLAWQAGRPLRYAVTAEMLATMA